MYFLLNDNLSLLEIMAISSVNGTQSLVLVIFAKKSLRMIMGMEWVGTVQMKFLGCLLILTADVVWVLTGWMRKSLVIPLSI